MRSNSAPIHIAGSDFGDERHVCAFFHSPEEKYCALLPFVRDGFDCGDQAFHIVDPDRHKAHFERLESAGIEMAPAVSRGQLKVCSWNEADLDPSAHSGQHRMVTLIEEELKLGAAELHLA